MRGSSRIGKGADGTVTSLINVASQKAQMIHNQELQAVDTDEVIADELWSFVKKTEETPA